LRSEGYTTEAGRENGINSVIKNLPLEERYATIQLADRTWVLSLKAGNHQEIAQSCPVASEEAAKAFLPSERAKAAEQRRLAALATANNQNNNEDTDRLDDDYMVCSVYESFINEKHPEYDDFISFYEEDTQKYYFAWINPDTKTIILRSEGYPTTAARNNGLESVRKNREIRERFKIEEKRNLYYLVLKAGNHQEIGRSCPHKTEAIAWAILPLLPIIPDILPEPEPIEAIILPVVIPEPEPIAEIIPPVVIPEPEPEPVAIAAPPVIPVIPKKKDVEDDYLPCSEYKNKPISDKRNNAALFKHKNGQYYFAIYNKEGSVRLRSEGFKTAKDRDRELSGV
ncbi:MAG TPA: YegP family protein, partial [Chitinophagales bacterium]|nr:YegP family protein [Chitinophagales bacterium]